MAALVGSGLSTNVNLSGTAIANGTSTPFTGTGTLTLSPGVSGIFNGTMAQLQTQSISGTVMVAGQTSPYNSSVVNAYEPATAAVAGESQSTEFDVAQQPIMIPTTVGTSVTMLGTLSRYSDSSLSVALGTVQVSVAVTKPLGDTDRHAAVPAVTQCRCNRPLSIPATTNAALPALALTVNGHAVCTRSQPVASVSDAATMTITFAC
jgi:hypothetical protein